MKAIILRETGPAENLRLEEVPELQSGPQEVVVRMCIPNPGITAELQRQEPRRSAAFAIAGGLTAQSKALD